MRRSFLFRSADEKPYLLKPRRSSWQRRLRWVAWGALLTLPSGLALLPAAMFLLIAPRFAHARVVGVLLLAGMATSEALGVARLIRCLRGEFDLLSALAFGALVLVFVILMYTGIFLAGFVLR